ncbi:MAG: GMC family oxidoreductase [Pseudomonadota bacterium]
MIFDLNEASADCTLSCDVAVVGAGIAGSILACELARTGRRVVLLESGGRTQEGETHPLNRVVQGADEYRGAEHGRFRCLGGTSTRWGGALIPFQREDIEPDWPLDFAELAAQLERAERLFAVPHGPYELAAEDRALGASSAQFRVRAAKWPGFRRRNVARLLETSLESPGGPAVWLNAHLTAMKLDDNGRVSGLEARGSHAALRLAASEVVIAAGAIESTRLLLKLDADLGGRLSNGSDCLGRYFHDHLSAPVAQIVRPRRRELTRLTGFRFEGSAMRNVRFELDGGMRREAALPGAFVHVASNSRTADGFDALRGIYRSVQRRALPSAADIGQLAVNAGWLSRAAWTRFVHQRVLPPDSCDFETHLVIEQVPVAGNRISLSPDQRDAFGVPLAHIKWRVSDTDLRNAQSVLAAFAKYWSGNARALLGDLALYPRDQWAESLMRGGGIYHPGGTLRLAATRSNGVVDADLRVFGVPNLRVLSTAVFPNGGSANPTLMLILFALRAADQLSAGS